MFGNYIKKPIRRKIDSMANTNVNLIEIVQNLLLWENQKKHGEIIVKVRIVLEVFYMIVVNCILYIYRNIQVFDIKD